MKNRVAKQILVALALGFSALLISPTAISQQALLLNEYPDSYVVQEGDSLWNIASQFLRDPQRWPEVWQADEYLDNSDFIYPGDTLRMTFVGGSPRILVQRGDRTVEQISPQMREQPLTSSIPAIPLEAIENSFTRNRIVTRAEFDAAPYIVANTSNNLALSTGDEILARGEWPLTTNSFEVYRENRVYFDEENELEIGMELEYLGFTTITAVEAADLRRLVINSGAKEIRVGDRLLIRQETRLDATIFPTQPPQYMEGQIIAFMSGEKMGSQLDTVVVNLGIRDNLETGDVLSVHRQGLNVVDEVERERMSTGQRFRSLFRGADLQLPDSAIGMLLVYRTFDQLSYAVILSAQEPVQLNNLVSSPP
ncbi:MAG: LysM peptidoglycan-binding domain-containing protein [Gammaproteobacteria bacterium]